MLTSAFASAQKTESSSPNHSGNCVVDSLLQNGALLALSRVPLSAFKPQAQKA
jgi:hypothetical protein